MDLSDIEKWRDTLAGLRQRLANIHYDEMIGFAESLGRSRRQASTPELRFNSPLPGRPMLSIPSGKGTMKKWTAKKILDVLEADIEAWEQEISRRAKGNGHV